MFFPRIRTKNFSSKELKDHKNGLSPQTMRSIVRLGSTTDTEVICPKSFNHKPIIEINSVEAIQNSRSKVKMKECFDKAKINHAKWQVLNGAYAKDDIKFPVVLKRIYGFKGKGMQLVDSKEELAKILPRIDLGSYMIETFHNYNREYRLHCTKEGCFYTCRKMLKQDAKTRWMRNDSNCIWILEENPLFNKPANWDEIIDHCKKALKATGLDIGAFDVKVQSAKTNSGKLRSTLEFIIIEVNSAPAFGEITTIKYKEALNNLISTKIKHYHD